MESMFFGLVGFGLFVFVLGGAGLAVYNWTRLRRLERSIETLSAELRRLGEGDIAVDDDLSRSAVAPPPTPTATPTGTAEQESRLSSSPSPGGPTAPRIKPLPAAPVRPDLESVVAGRWLNRVAIVALLMAAAFFLKYAFDNDWIGPGGRVAIGLVAGTGLMVASQWLLGRGYRYFSEGIAALGGGVLFLSLYAAWSFYSLIPQPVAFAGMVAVTAALTGLAFGRDSQRLAVLALVAGLATPGLLSSGQDAQIERFTYLAVLVAGFLALGWRKAWRWLAPLAFAGLLVFYLIDWVISYGSADRLLITCFFVTVFFLEFSTYLVFRARSSTERLVVEQLLTVVNSLWLGVALHHLLYDDHRWWLTVAVLTVAAAHLLAVRLLAAADKHKVMATRFVFAGLALTFATAAIAIRLEGEWITIAWALEAAVLTWAGFRSGVGALRAAGIVLFVLVVGLLLSQSAESSQLFLNKRFASFVATVAALVASGIWARPHWQEMGHEEQRVLLAMGAGATGLTIWGLSEEVWYFLGRQQWNLEPRLAQQMGLSLLWVVAAGVLVFLGARRGSAALRWQGLALMGLAIGKVFLLDLSFLERAYRIASFLVLGIVLLAVSFWYQRNLAESRVGKETEDRDK